MTTTELLRREELRSAEVLADHVAKEVDSAFRSLVTAQRLIQTLNDVVLVPKGIQYARPEHGDEMLRALERLDRIEGLDVWEIETAGVAAGTVRDILGLARHQEEKDDRDV